MQAINRVEDRLRAISTVASETKPSTADYVFIKQDTRLVKILFDDFLFAEAQRDFTYVFLKQKKLLASMHLKMLEEILPNNLFVRIHRSFLINVNAITTIHGNILEIGENEIPIGSSYKERLFHILGL